MKPSSSRSIQGRDWLHNGAIVLSDSDDEVEYVRQEGPPSKKRKSSVGHVGLANGEAGPSHNGGPSGQLAPEIETRNAHRRDERQHQLIAKNGQSHSSQVQDGPRSAHNHISRGPTSEQPETLRIDAEDSTDHYLSQVLEVVPDVQPDHALALISSFREVHGNNVLEFVLHNLLENTYPKIERNKGKRKRDKTDDGRLEAKVLEIDYFSPDRLFQGGPNYVENAFEQLLADFLFIPKPHVRNVHFRNRYLYAPAYLQLLRESQMENPPFRRKTIPNKPSTKGKAYDAELERERQWVLGRLENLRPQNEAGPPLPPNPLSMEDDGDIECGCCFSNYSFEKMIQCPEAHLFCVTCMTSYVSDRLGQHNPKFVCMDQSGCKAIFTDSELGRFLDEKLLSLYHRVKQSKEIEAAGLDGLEECPFCDYKVVIENPEEKLFRCEKEECGTVSCRSCKKLDHLPKSCKEAEEDHGLDARHKVEEAMTEALMRNCPKCKKPFIKEAGCNKMTCPHCNTLSCYICRRSIDGYEHFDQRTAEVIKKSSSKSNKCPLWDPVEKRHDDDVAKARQRAIELLSKENPEVERNILEVDLPQKSKPNAPAPMGHEGNRPPNYRRGIQAGPALARQIGLAPATQIAIRARRERVERRQRPENEVRRAEMIAALRRDQERIAAVMAHVPPPPPNNGFAVHFGVGMRFGVPQQHPVPFAFHPGQALPQWAGPLHIAANPMPELRQPPRQVERH